MSDFTHFTPSIVAPVEQAIGIANAITASDRFYQRIANKQEAFDARFTSAEAVPERLAEVLRNSPVTVTVYLAKHRRRILGWINGNDHTQVFLNVRRLNRPVADIVRTLVHEWVHAVDATHPWRFDHGGNSPSGKQGSAPYWIDREAGTLASEMLCSLADVVKPMTEDALACDGDEFVEGPLDAYLPGEDDL